MRSRHSLSVCAIACVALIGCGAGSGNKAGSGGSVGQGGTTPGSDASTPGSGGNVGIADAAADQPSAKWDGPVATNSCPGFTPCGGDLLGTWNLATECFSPSSMPSSCTSSVAGADISGYWLRFIFNTDGTVSFTSGGTTDVTLRYSAGCLLSSSTPAQACANLQQSITQQMGSPTDSGSPSVTLDKIECSMHEDACLCEEVISRSELTLTLGYSTSGTQLFLYPPGDAGAPDAIPYCVSGNTLTLPMSSGDGYMTFRRA